MVWFAILVESIQKGLDPDVESIGRWRKNAQIDFGLAGAYLIPSDFSPH